MTLDQAARDRITRDFKTSFCVEAGAGTGKTTLMVSRVLNQVVSSVPISRIVAITFTEKAAGELKQRIREALEKARFRSPDSFQLLTQALSELENAQISTIHGLAASLLRERPVEARVDPNFVQLDELGSGLFVEQVWDRWLDSALASSNDTLKTALSSGLTMEQIQQLFRALYQHREYAGQLPGPLHSIAQAGEKIREIMAQVETFLPYCKDPEADKGFQQWRQALESFARVLPHHPLLLVKFLRELKLNRSLGSKLNWKAGYSDRLKDKVGELLEVRDQVYASILADLLLLLRQAVAQVEEEKNRRNALDFDDLLLKARDLLLKDKVTRRYFQEQYQFVIVDEFQDTDPLQVEIVFFLCEQGAQADRWQDVTLQPGKLCIVGDPKQSIYRFRRADIETYMEAQEKIEAQGRVENIQENFRSARELVDWVNQVFSWLIQRGERYQPEYQELLTSAEPSPEGAQRVTLLYCAPPPASMEECRKMEAEALVSLLRRIHDQRWQVRDRISKQLRDPRWGDIAVLLYALTKSHIYESALRAGDIPYRLEGGKQFFTRQEIHALVACLKAIDDPTDQIALVGALRSLFFGFSDEEIFRLRLRIGSLSYFKTLPGAQRDAGSTATPSDLDADMQRALHLLRSLHEERNRVSLAATLERLYRETHALEKHLLTRFGQQAVANLQKAVVTARAFEQTGPTTFRRFVKWLYQLEDEERQEPESVLVETEDNAVQLLSIHKAKGLEFPIVILANLSSGSNEQFTALLDRPSGALEFRINAGSEEKVSMETAGFRLAKEMEDKRLEAERKRLLYVGATRARDHLIVSAFHSEKPAGPLKHLLEKLPPAPDCEEEIRPMAAPEEASELLEQFSSRSSALTLKGETGGAAVTVRLWKVPPPDLPPDPELSTSVELAAERSPTWEESLQQWRSNRAAAFDRARVSWSPNTASAAQRGTAAELSFAAPRLARMYESSVVGSAFHRLMYRMSIGDLKAIYSGTAEKGLPALPEDRDERLKPLVEQTVLEYGLDDPAELWQLIEGPVPACLSTAFHQARGFFREVPFLLDLPGESGVASKKFPHLYEGVVDIILEQPGGALLILDYKTDRVTAAEIPARMAHYSRQAEIYRAALEQATSRKLSDVYFYFVRPGLVYSHREGVLK